MIDLDSLIPGSAWFRWREALWCEQWKCHVFPDNNQYANIIKTAKVMDAIRGRLGSKPLKILSWLRPDVYNKLIKGALESQHTLGLACDFTSPIMSPDEIREELYSELSRMLIRMENFPQSGWVHVDLKDPGLLSRFFVP